MKTFIDSLNELLDKINKNSWLKWTLGPLWFFFMIWLFMYASELMRNISPVFFNTTKDSLGLVVGFYEIIKNLFLWFYYSGVINILILIFLVYVLVKKIIKYFRYRKNKSLDKNTGNATNYVVFALVFILALNIFISQSNGNQGNVEDPNPDIVFNNTIYYLSDIRDSKTMTEIDLVSEDSELLIVYYKYNEIGLNLTTKNAADLTRFKYEKKGAIVLNYFSAPNSYNDYDGYYINLYTVDESKKFGDLYLYKITENDDDIVSLAYKISISGNGEEEIDNNVTNWLLENLMTTGKELSELDL